MKGAADNALGRSYTTGLLIKLCLWPFTSAVRKHTTLEMSGIKASRCNSQFHFVLVRSVFLRPTPITLSCFLVLVEALTVRHNGTESLNKRNVLVFSFEWMNECFYFRVIKNWWKASLVLHTRKLKEYNGKKLKQNTERYGLRTAKVIYCPCNAVFIRFTDVFESVLRSCVSV